jgi:hypothetical protein
MSTPFYDLASMVVLPSGYKSGKIYAQKPLTTDGQLTFTRASTATRVNASGLIETVSSGVPRLDYLGSTCPKLLLEPQRTNLALYSEQFNNAAWDNAGGAIVSANTTVAPDGTTTADTATFGAGSAILRQITTSLTPSVSYTFTAYVKKSATSGANNVRLTINNTVSWSGAGSTKITLTNSWQRISLTWTSDVNAYLIIGSVDQNGNPDTSCYGNVDIWGAQFEQGAYATSYIPTTTAAVTRLGDVATKTGISSLIGQTEGTLFVDVSGESLQDNSRYMSISDFNDPNKRITIYQASGKINVYCSAGSTFNLDYNPPAGRLKIAFGYKSGQYVLYVNGVNAASSTEAVVQGCPDLGLGVNEYLGTANPPAVGYNQVLLFKTRLTNAQLAELTTL